MIETDRLVLRPFREGDAGDVYEYLREAQTAVKEKMTHHEYCFAIVLKDTGNVIGEIEAHPESSQPDMAEN